MNSDASELRISLKARSSSRTSLVNNDASAITPTIYQTASEIGVKRGSLLETLENIMDPSRLEALSSCDRDVLSYDSYNFFSRVFSIRGRNTRMVLAPLISLFLWGLTWSLLFLRLDSSSHYNENVSRYVSTTQHFFEAKDALITPLLTPLSFLLTFRLARSAVSLPVGLYWSGRTQLTY